MMLSQWCFVVALALVGLAGCAENVSDRPPPPVASYVRDVEWNGCQGVWTVAVYSPGEVPRQNPQWEDGVFPPYDGVELNFVECNRVSWGPFERPVRMILEIEGISAWPESCIPTDPDAPSSITMGVLASVWVNDTQLVPYLRAEYDLPVHVAEVEVAVDNTTPVPEQVWRWSEPGKPKSELRTPIDPLPQRRDSTWDVRTFWFNKTAVAALDVHWDFDGPFSDENSNVRGGMRSTHGKLESPMLGSVSPTYLGNGEWQDDIEWTGRITKFTDHFCTQEVP